MSRGQRRIDMLNVCPDGFHEILESFIGEIEDAVNDIKDKLDISGISDINSIEEAYDMASKLSDELY